MFRIFFALFFSSFYRPLVSSTAYHNVNNRMRTDFINNRHTNFLSALRLHSLHHYCLFSLIFQHFISVSFGWNVANWKFQIELKFLACESVIQSFVSIFLVRLEVKHFILKQYNDNDITIGTMGVLFEKSIIVYYINIRSNNWIPCCVEWLHGIRVAWNDICFFYIHTRLHINISKTVKNSFIMFLFNRFSHVEKEM